MLVWSQTAPSGTDSAACPITARTAAPSMSIVITNAASRTASGGRLGQVRPLGRQHARLVEGAVPYAHLENPPSAVRAIGAPMISGAEKRDPLPLQIAPRTDYARLQSASRQVSRARMRTCLCCRPSTLSVQMPSLPASAHAVGRSRMPSMSPHARGSLSFQSDGLTWIHLEAPDPRRGAAPLARFGWHPLDVEDVLSRRERPKVDVYSEEESAGYSSPSSTSRSNNAAVGRLDAGELDVFVGPNYSSPCLRSSSGPSRGSSSAATRTKKFRRNLFSRGSGRVLYELLDDLYDYCFPILDKIGLKLRQIDERSTRSPRARRSAFATSTR